MKWSSLKMGIPKESKRIRMNSARCFSISKINKNDESFWILTNPERTYPQIEKSQRTQEYFQKINSSTGKF